MTNPAVMELILEFDSNPSKSSIAQVLSKIYKEPYFLGNRARRSILLQHLNTEDAISLLDNLGEKTSDKGLWRSLEEFAFGRNSMNTLYDFFSFQASENTPELSNTSHLRTELIESSYSLFKHQEEAANKIKKIILSDNNCSRALLHMPTGSGKTRTTMSIICDYIRNDSNRLANEKRLIVWLADSEELCDQAAEEFIKSWSFLGVGSILLHRFYGDYDQDLKNLELGGVLIAGLQKINSRLGKSQDEILKLGRGTELLIFDEAHKILAPTYKQLIELFQATGNAPLIGLSATPGRSTFDDDHNREFANFFGKQKVTLQVEGYNNPIDYLQDNGFIAKTNYHNLPYSPKDLELTTKQIKSMSSGNEIPESILKKLGIDTKRNILIIESALKEEKNGKQIIVFSCSVENAEAIYAILQYKNISVGIVTGKTPTNERKTVIGDYKEGRLNIIVNYGVLTTGFDAPRTSVAIIARPTTSLTLYSQMIGRAVRGEKAGGNKESDIYTVVDSIFPAFQSMAEAFTHWDDSWA